AAAGFTVLALEPRPVYGGGVSRRGRPEGPAAAALAVLPGRMSPNAGPTPTVLNAYLLGTVPFEMALRLQRHLVYRVSGDRGQGCVVLCEHPPLLTVGRQGNLAGLRCDPEELRRRGWAVRWVNRGGGCLLHAPGQLAVHP